MIGKCCHRLPCMPLKFCPQVYCTEGEPVDVNSWQNGCANPCCCCYCTCVVVLWLKSSIVCFLNFFNLPNRWYHATTATKRACHLLYCVGSPLLILYTLYSPRDYKLRVWWWWCNVMLVTSSYFSFLQVVRHFLETRQHFLHWKKYN